MSKTWRHGNEINEHWLVNDAGEIVALVIPVARDPNVYCYATTFPHMSERRFVDADSAKRAAESELDAQRYQVTIRG